MIPGKSLRIATLLVAAAADDVETADTPAVPCFATLLTTKHTNLRFREIKNRGSYNRRSYSRKSNDRRSDGRSNSRRSVDASKEEVCIEQLLLFEHGSSRLHDITSQPMLIKVLGTHFRVVLVDLESRVTIQQPLFECSDGETERMN